MNNKEHANNKTQKRNKTEFPHMNIIKQSKLKKLTTHEWITSHFNNIDIKEIAFYSAKKNQCRKIQDQFCYIHARAGDSKVFNSKEHRKLEKAINNNLKFFHIEHIQEYKRNYIATLMLEEAQKQKNMLKSMSFIQVVLCQYKEINFFLSYSYSRSYDHYKTILGDS